MATDYIGKYVKQFESGSKGSLCLVSCGNDWGLSCGSYQLTLRWGNCIHFLKEYFPKEASVLYFNNKPDITTASYPGKEYCSSPEAVKSVWMKCYNKVGADTFFEYEHKHIQKKYYDRIKEKIKSVLDLDTLSDRAYKECFWSWSVHKGINGAYNGFMEVLTENGITDLTYIDKEYLFDLIYDKRFEVNPFRRYKKGLTNGESEREILRKLLTPGTISGKKAVEETIPDYCKFKELNGTIKVIFKSEDGINVRTEPSFESEPVTTYKYGTELRVVAIDEYDDFYKLENGFFIIKHDSYVKFTEDKVPIKVLYMVRIAKDSVPIYSGSSGDSKIVGYVKKNQVFTIIEESDGFGYLKSGVGWLPLDKESVKPIKNA